MIRCADAPNLMARRQRAVDSDGAPTLMEGYAALARDARGIAAACGKNRA